MSGFEFRETMAGSYHLVGEPDRERPFSFTIRARSPRLSAFARRPVVEIEGEVDAEGLADHRPLRGTLDMDLARTRRLRYRFEFDATDGRPCVFEGEKVLRLGDLVTSMTVLPGQIRALAAPVTPIAEALLRFDLKSDLLGFLRSFRRTL